VYIRSSICVQSCASVPPAPEWTSQIFEVAPQSTDVLGDLRFERCVVLVPCQLVQHIDVRKPPFELVDELDVLAHARHLGRHLARPIGIVPKIGRARLLLQIREPSARLVDVQVFLRLGDSTREITDLFREVLHSTPLRRVDSGSARHPAPLHLHLP